METKNFKLFFFSILTWGALATMPMAMFAAAEEEREEAAIEVVETAGAADGLLVSPLSDGSDGNVSFIVTLPQGVEGIEALQGVVEQVLTSAQDATAQAQGLGLLLLGRVSGLREGLDRITEIGEGAHSFLVDLGRIGQETQRLTESLPGLQEALKALDATVATLQGQIPQDLIATLATVQANLRTEYMARTTPDTGIEARLQDYADRLTALENPRGGNGTFHLPRSVPEALLMTSTGIGNLVSWIQSGGDETSADERVSRGEGFIVESSFRDQVGRGLAVAYGGQFALSFVPLLLVPKFVSDKVRQVKTVIVVVFLGLSIFEHLRGIRRIGDEEQGRGNSGRRVVDSTDNFLIKWCKVRDGNRRLGLIAVCGFLTSDIGRLVLTLSIKGSPHLGSGFKGLFGTLLALLKKIVVGGSPSPSGMSDGDVVVTTVVDGGTVDALAEAAENAVEPVSDVALGNLDAAAATQ